MTNQKFKALQDKWYAKAKASGYEDIEYPNGSIRNAGIRNYAVEPVHREAVESYYRMATHFLNEHKFESEFDKIVWEYHSNGLSNRNISKVLSTTIAKKPSREIIRKVVKKLSTVMKQKYLAP